MLISEKQHAANIENAQKSCGPKTPEGRAAIRFNALTFGLRTRAIIIEGENAAAYSQLWDDLEADWKPEGRTETCYLETMVISQWLLIRAAHSEAKILDRIAFGPEQFIMLGYVIKLRTQLERSFRTAVHDLQQLQKQRPSRPQPQPMEPVIDSRVNFQRVPPAAKPPVPPPAYARSEAAASGPVSCAPTGTDSR